MLNQEVTTVLIDQLAEIIEERKIGYQKASDKITDPYLKELFKAHSSYSENLKKGISKCTDNDLYTPLNEVTPIKWKYWSEMKNALKSSCRADLLSACIEGEQRLVDLYQELIKEPNLTNNMKAIFTKQFQDVKSARDLLKIFKICL